MNTSVDAALRKRAEELKETAPLLMAISGGAELLEWFGGVELVPGAVIHKLVHSQRYSEVNQFLSEFPECCKFVAANSGDGGPEADIWDRIRGVRTVELSYDKRYAATTARKTAPSRYAVECSQ